MKAVTTEATKSAIGILSHTPNVPKNEGKINKLGIKKSIWRVKERKIAFFYIPMERKKLVATIWKPTKGKTAKTMRKP